MNEAPAEYTQAGMFMLIGGIMNVVLGLSWACASVWILLATWGLGCICCILPFVFWAAGGFEIATAMKMQQGVPAPNAKIASILGIVAGVMGFNVISIVMEVLVMMNLGKPEVTEWLATAAPQLEG